MDETDLQIGIVAGQDIDKIDLLTANNLRQPLAILMRKHIEIGMRQFVTQNIDAISGTQNADPDRRGGDNLAVKLLMLLQTLGVAFRWNENTPLIHPREGKQRRPGDHIEQNRVEDQHTYAFQHLINGHRVNNS